MGANMGKDRDKSWEVATLDEHEACINVLSVSEDGSMVITGSDDCTARLWCTTTDKQIGVLEKGQKRSNQPPEAASGHLEPISAIGQVRDFVITGSYDHTIRKWDMVSCKCLNVYTGHTDRVLKLLVSDKYIFSASTDKTCKLWRLEEEDEDEDIEICLRTFEGHTAPVRSICYIQGDEQEDAKKKKTRINEDGEEEEEEEDEDEEEEPECEDGINRLDMVITGSFDGTARCWSMERGKQIKIFKANRGPISCMTIDDEGKLLYTAHSDTICEWDIEKGVRTSTKLMRGHTKDITCMQLVNKLLYTGSVDADAKCFVTEFGDCTRTYTGQTNTISCLKFHQGILFTCSSDGDARAYDAKSGKQKRVYSGHQRGITCMCVVDKKLYTGADDGQLRVWDADVPSWSEELTRPPTRQSAVSPVPEPEPASARQAA
ncbi:WD repeat-containing protein 86-like isoform X2 [Amphibalanus amphitrite]|uniref:WD repeat-containing protein 86-like isoform X2 n=1 Tax=Amphibalanus amphitrite TaxID=1232801 RepID=UPI001C91C56F|nr:WD repeat-containing protein 86-like isoform X2 [Amphibalanus amphitrite]XP_043225271.1 WD repeat-containing protein 86-like isoform X2 [Amphibalanus amphitrite]